MNRPLTLLAALLLIALGVFWGCYRLATRPTAALLAHPQSELEWLREEYHLTDTQYAAIRQLHDAYRPGCADRCQRIAAMRGELRTLTTSGSTLTPAIETALHDSAALEEECRTSLIRHIYAVSAAMAPAEGDRYRATALSQLLGTGADHAAMMGQSHAP
jgi:hypothetical protein